MKYLVDIDNEQKTVLSVTQTVRLEEAFGADKVTDCCGDVLTWEEVLDCQGDVCVDEDAYDQCRALLKR